MGQSFPSDIPPAGGPPLRADARRNRALILLAARRLFAADGSDAPLDEVARRAGVGIGTLYRHFPDRQALLRAVAVDVLQQVADEAARAFAEESDAFAALARYMHRALALQVGTVMPALVDRIAEEDAALVAARAASVKWIQALVDGAHAAGALRPEIQFGDIGLLLVRLGRPLPGPIDQQLDEQLAHRHLDLLLDGMRASAARSSAPLSGPALALADLRSLAAQREPPS